MSRSTLAASLAVALALFACEATALPPMRIFAPRVTPKVVPKPSPAPLPHFTSPKYGGVSPHTEGLRLNLLLRSLESTASPSYPWPSSFTSPMFTPGPPKFAPLPPPPRFQPPPPPRFQPPPPLRLQPPPLPKRWPKPEKLQNRLNTKALVAPSTQRPSLDSVSRLHTVDELQQFKRSADAAPQPQASGTSSPGFELPGVSFRPELAGDAKALTGARQAQSAERTLGTVHRLPKREEIQQAVMTPIEADRVRVVVGVKEQLIWISQGSKQVCLPLEIRGVAGISQAQFQQLWRLGNAAQQEIHPWQVPEAIVADFENNTFSYRLNGQEHPLNLEEIQGGFDVTYPAATITERQTSLIHLASMSSASPPRRSPDAFIKPTFEHQDLP